MILEELYAVEQLMTRKRAGEKLTRKESRRIGVGLLYAWEQLQQVFSIQKQIVALHQEAKDQCDEVKRQVESLKTARTQAAEDHARIEQIYHAYQAERQRRQSAQGMSDIHKFWGMFSFALEADKDSFCLN